MKKLLYLFIIVLFGTIANQAKGADPLHGHIIAPQYMFLNADATQAISVGLADIVLWDLTTAKPTLRIDLGNIIKDYNPWNTKFKIKASPSPTFKELVLEIETGGKLTAYIFNMTTGLFSVNDKAYFEKLYGFDYKGNYYVVDNLRTQGQKPASITRLVEKPNGNTNPKVLASIVTIWPTGYSYDGKIIYGQDGLKDRLIYLDTETMKIEKTNLKYNPSKYKHTRFEMKNLLYTSEWITNAPIQKNPVLTYYHIKTKKVIEYEKNLPVKGPYMFSDDGKYGLYVSKKGDEKISTIIIKNVFSEARICDLPLPAGNSRLNQSRMIGGASPKLFLFTNTQKSLNAYDLKNGELLSSLDLMANQTMIAMNKAAREQLLGKTTTTTDGGGGAGGSTLSGKDDYQFKDFLVNFEPIKHFYFNVTNAQNLKGRDITELPYTKNKYYPGGSTKVKSVLALGKLAQCDNTVIIFGVVRAILNNKEDKTMFFMEKIDANGKSLKFENVGVMSKGINGGAFNATTDLGVYQANDKVAIVTEQRDRIGKSNKFSNKKRTIMIDQLTCEIWDKK